MFGIGKKSADTTPAPGGVQGGVVDFTYYYPPFRPYGWGEAFPHEWGLNYFSQWINSPVPPWQWETALPNIEWLSHQWPGIALSSYPGLQLNAMTPNQQLTAATAQALNARSTAQSQAFSSTGMAQAVGGFYQVE